MNTDTGKIAALGIVESTKASQVFHLVRQVLSRPNFLPRGLWTDTWPKGKVYWEAMLGETIHGRLGLFHFIKRIVDTLQPNHDEFWTALVSLKECVYQYKPEDYQALIETLKSQTMLSSGYRYSNREFHELLHSKRWHQRYDKYLEKIVFPPAVARAKLTTWFQRFKGWRDPMTDQNLFTVDTKTSFDEQCKNVEFLGDIPEVPMYRMVPPGPKSRHGLSPIISC
jgi:hypothetical protein